MHAHRREWERKGCWAVLGLTCLSAWAAEPEALQRFEFQQPQMGLPFRIVLYAPDASQAQAAAAAAFARIAELNSVFSDYEDDSELMRLSQNSGKGEWTEVSKDMVEVLQQAQALSQRSGGAFDITVGPVVQLWRRARRQRELPPPERIAEALTRSGYQRIELDQPTRRVLLEVPGMRLDAGGIAKGYAVDEALKVLGAWDVGSALVAGGGDLAVSKPPPDHEGWRIDIAALDTNSPPGHVLLANAGLATSGDIFQNLQLNGQRYSHILDPRTGLALTNSCLVTVVATNCATADSLATAVSVLGPVDGLKLIENTPGGEARIVFKEGNAVRTVQSAGWNQLARER